MCGCIMGNYIEQYHAYKSEADYNFETVLESGILENNLFRIK